MAQTALGRARPERGADELGAELLVQQDICPYVRTGRDVSVWAAGALVRAALAEAPRPRTNKK
jgi:hypothetical protein